MSVTERTTKARASAMFGKVTERDAQGRVKVVLVPGSEAKLYQVIIRRKDAHSGLDKLSCECNCQTSLGNVPCKGNTGLTLCYHSMAAIILASGITGVEVSFCDNSNDAMRLRNLGRTITPVYAHNANGVIWLSTRKPAPQPVEQLTPSEEHRLAIRNAMYGEA